MKVNTTGTDMMRAKIKQFNHCQLFHNSKEMTLEGHQILSLNLFFTKNQNCQNHTKFRFQKKVKNFNLTEILERKREIDH
jgi:hypothetical protein